MPVAQELNFLDDVVKPEPRQQEFLDAMHNCLFGLYGGAMGGGKSYILRWWLVQFLLELAEKGVRNATVGMFCEDYPSLHDRQISKIAFEFPEWLGRLRVGDVREFVLRPEYGGGRIALRNLDDPSKYQSSEFAAIAVDELTKNDVTIFNFLRTRLRWPGVERTPFGAGTNPGDKGHAWVKDYWINSKFPPELQSLAHEFRFVPSKASDNSHLDATYFERLKTLPPHMAKAYAEGSWDLFAGQYFDVFSAAKHVRPAQDVIIKPWWPRWISIDWGFQHPSAVYWHTKDGDNVITYRELHGALIGEEELGKQIAELTGKEKIEHVFLSPDAFAKRGSQNTVAQQIGTELDKAGLPFPSQADNDRVGGARLMHQLLKTNLWTISSACPKLIECLPTLIHDEPPHAEDVLKVDATENQLGDDPYDSARYGLKSMLDSKEKPYEYRLTEALDAQPDYTQKHILHLKMEDEHQAERRQLVALLNRRVRRGRVN